MSEAVGRAPVSPVAVAQIVARNIVPLAGVLFLGWRVGSVLLLYFLDTMLSIAVIMAGLMSVFARTDANAARLGPIKISMVAIFMAAFFAIPLGMPVFILLAANNIGWRELVNDPGLRTGALMQTLAALWSYVELLRALRIASPEQLRIKRRFALVLLRWIGVLMTIYIGLGVFLPVLVVVAYAALSIWSEIAPDKFLRSAGDTEDAADVGAPGPTAVTPARAPPPQALLRKRRRRRS